MKGIFGNIDLTQGSIGQGLLLFAVPLLITNVFQQLYNVADTMIVGNYLGDQALAAVGATGAIFELVIGFALGIGAGMAIVIARYYGARQSKMVKQATAATLILGSFLSILVMVLGHFGLYPLLELLGTPPAIIDQSYTYIYQILIWVFVAFAYNLGAAMLRAVGNSLVPLLILAFSSVFNVLLDWVFITQFKWGLLGAAYATIIAQALSALLCFAYIFVKVPVLLPSKDDFTINTYLYRELMNQGLAMGFVASIVSIGTVILQTAVNGFGVMTIAAQTSARKILFFFTMPPTSLSTALTTMVSQNYGAGKMDRVKDAMRLSNLAVIAWSVLAGLVLALVTPALMRLLSGSTDPALIQRGYHYILVAIPFTPFLNVLVNLRDSLQGLGYKIQPLMSSVIELVGKILFVIFIIPHLGYLGVMLTEPLLWTIMCGQLYLTYREKVKEVSRLNVGNLR